MGSIEKVCPLCGFRYALVSPSKGMFCPQCKNMGK